MRSIELNPYVVGLKESSTLKINQVALAKRRAGETVCHFGFGQSPFPIPPQVVEELKQYADRKEYLPTKGLLELRKAIASYYKSKFSYDFDEELILIGPGSKELLFQAIYALEGPVIVPAPSWVSYGPQVNLKGKEITPVETQESNGYKITSEELANVCRELGEGQKLLILNSPNNPTGAVYGDEEIQALAKVCEKENVIVLADEIYGEVDFSFNRKKGFFHYYPNGTLVTSGLSKAHSAGGYRLGFLAAGPALRPLVEALTSLVSETFSAVSSPIQYSAVRAYSGDDDLEEYLRDCANIHKACGSYMAIRFQEMGASCPQPEGAFYLMPNFEAFRQKLKAKAVRNSQELCDLFLKELNVAMLPGSDFYLPDERLACRVASVDYDGGRVLQAYLRLKDGGDMDEKAFVEENCPNLKAGLDLIQNYLEAL